MAKYVVTLLYEDYKMLQHEAAIPISAHTPQSSQLLLHYTKLCQANTDINVMLQLRYPVSNQLHLQVYSVLLGTLSQFMAQRQGLICIKQILQTLSLRLEITEYVVTLLYEGYKMLQHEADIPISVHTPQSSQLLVHYTKLCQANKDINVKLQLKYPVSNYIEYTYSALDQSLDQSLVYFCNDYAAAKY